MPARQYRTNDHGLIIPTLGAQLGGVMAILWLALLWGCMPQPSPEEHGAAFIKEQSKGAVDGSATQTKAEAANAEHLPIRYQRPSYLLQSAPGADNNLAIPVGAKIAPAGPKPLRLVMQELAKLKGMNISWANDVDKDALVHVTIMPEEDFFEAIDNVLRQLDYFHEMQGNTIMVGHKETRKFHIAMPFMSSSYSTGVGGDVLGTTHGGNMSGTLNINSAENKFDIWANIEKNLDKILQIWSAPPPPVAVPEGTTPATATATPPPPAAAAPAAAGVPATNASPENSGRSGLGYYTIDRPIGLISVTAPRSLLAKIETYINNLSGEIYRQVSIEAKIVEVTLANDNTTGLDWSSLLHTSIGASLDPGKFRPDTGLNGTRTTVTTKDGVSSSTSMTGPNVSQTTAAAVGGAATAMTTTGPDSSITVVGPDHAASTAAETITQSGSVLTQRFVTMTPINFNVLIDAMKEQGNVDVLSNPKISVMNGQPAMISVGENVTYIKSIASTTDEKTGTISYTVTPDSVMSGLGMGVIATIMDDNQIILSLTPVTSALTQPIEYRAVGTNQVGLPRVNLREMSTMVRVKSGEMLVVGGLTDSTSAYNNTSVAGLGAIPGPLGKLFRRDGTNSRRKELIILLKPQIISMQ